MTTSNKKNPSERVKEWRVKNRQKWITSRRAREKNIKFRSKPQYIWYLLKRNSLCREREFNLGKTEFLEWYSSQTKECYYCGVDEEKHKRILNTRLEIDRVVNELPYRIDNMVLCCRYCNSTKGSYLNKEEMIFIGKNVIKQKWALKN